MAFTCSSAQVRPSARPVSSTSTTGLPAACTASSNSSCRPGRSMLSRSQFSPQVRPKAEYRWEFSPSTRMLTSADAAFARAKRMRSSVMLPIFPPKQRVSTATPGAMSRMPSSTVTTLSAGCGAAQSPRIVWLSAFGPHTKSFRTFVPAQPEGASSQGNRGYAPRLSPACAGEQSGNVPSFFRRTRPWRAASSAVSLCCLTISGDKTVLSAVAEER